MPGHRLSVLILSSLTTLAAGCHGVDNRMSYSPKNHTPNPAQHNIASPPTNEVPKRRTAPPVPVAATKAFPLKPGQTADVASLRNVRPASQPHAAVEQPVALKPPTGKDPARTGKAVVAQAKFVSGTAVETKKFDAKGGGGRSEAKPPDAVNAGGFRSSNSATHRQIDLATSLAMVAGQSPQVAFVQERVREAWARLDAAEALWLPSVRFGVSYNKHEGNLQDIGGRVFDVSRGSTYAGLGAQAVGAGSPIVPGLFTQFHLADAIFQPMIARRTVSARRYRVSATTNDELLQAALAYVELVQAGERKRIGEQTKTDLKKLADLTASFAKRGQGTQADADRAQTELQLQTNVVTRAEESQKIASARLAEVVNAGDGLQLLPIERNVVPVDLVPVDSETAGLVMQALRRRPELCENYFQQTAAWDRYRRERYAPFIPNVGLGMSYGGFAGGTGSTIASDRDRFDFDALLYWEIRNFGVGERAARNTAKSRMRQIQYRRARLTNLVRREVTEAHAQLVSAAKQIPRAEVAVISANDSMTRNFERIRQGQGLPLEVLQSIQALDAAKRERLNAKSAYNRAQFRLHRAIGWPTDR